MKAFGAHLRRARRATKLSAREVSESIGISLTFIYDCEKANKKPSLETVIKLSQLYKDPSLINDFMRVNNISDVQIDVSMNADKQRIFEELNRANPDNHIAKTIGKIVSKSDEALTEWTGLVKEFIEKYTTKKPNGDDTE